MTTIEKIIEVRKYCKANNIKVIKGDEWCACYELNAIFYHKNYKINKKWLYSALHEVGHLIIFNDVELWKKEFWRLYELENVLDDCHTVVDGISATQIMLNEIKAWDKGYELSEKIGISVNKKDYYLYASGYLIKYMKNIPAKLKLDSKNLNYEIQ